MPKSYRVHIHDHNDQGRWLAQQDFAKRPTADQINAAFPQLAEPGRYEVSLNLVRPDGEEVRAAGWVQGTCSQCGCGGTEQHDDEPAEPEHVDYPHPPGYLHDCPACEASCHCTANASECVFEGEHNGLAQLNLKLAGEPCPLLVTPGVDYQVVTDDGQRVGWVVCDGVARPEAYNAAGQYIGEADTPELAAAMVRQPPMPQHCDLEGPHKPHDGCVGTTIEEAAEPVYHMTGQQIGPCLRCGVDPDGAPDQDMWTGDITEVTCSPRLPEDNADGNPYTPYTPEHRVWAKAQEHGKAAATRQLEGTSMTSDGWRHILSRIPEWRSHPGLLTGEPQLHVEGGNGYTRAALLQAAGWVPHDGTLLADDLASQYESQARITFWNEIERRCLAALPHRQNGEPITQLGQTFITCSCGTRFSGGVGDTIAQQNMAHHLKIAREARET